MQTKFWQNYFLGKGFAKTSAYLFLNSDVANGKGGVWGGIFHLFLFCFGGIRVFIHIDVDLTIVRCRSNI